MEQTAGIPVGGRIRELRTGRGYSLAALAARAGIGKGSLSELESGRRNPTLATLYALATALGVPLSALLAERVGSQLSDQGLTATLIGTQHPSAGVVVEIFSLEFTAGADRRSAPEQPGSREHLLVTRGRLELSHAGGRAELTVGDSLTFASDAPHRYRALDDHPAGAVLVITSPDGAPTASRPRTPSSGG